MNEALNKLFEYCKQEHVYSVKESCQALGIDYSELKMFSLQDDECNRLFLWCKSKCLYNMMNAGLFGKLSLRKAHQYWCELDDEFAKEFGHETVFDDGS